ncbi:NADH-quinone oxidoreductase subunit J [uncultured Microbulbifer sp.]|uniref:NADH-quinone oxidoreductase subunit J n=1 Tax=uncultured Microbulbifer sp. TaxID=348147 RepID=UPI0025D11605|nr:NADH-quinone oxidoreductase subunit J [uncultured Microbulbifer sp.]
MIENSAFYLTATIAIAATTLVICSRNAVHALLWLIVSLLATAVIFFQLGAPLAAALEVIVYAGAILVLMVFVIMLLNQGQAAVTRESEWLRGQNWLGPTLLTAILLLQMLYLLWSGTGNEDLAGAAVARSDTSPKAVGLAMFSEYLLAVELASLLLLAGLVGACHLARHPGRNGAAGGGSA